MVDLPSPSAAFPGVAVASPQGIRPSKAAPVALASPGATNWDPVRQRLLGASLVEAHKAATEIIEGIEIVHTNEFQLMLAALLPVFSSILTHRVKPHPDPATAEHKLRNVVLEVITRMPSNEVLRPHAPHLVAVSVDVLNKDYEENALLASRIIFDLFKVYRALPHDQVQPYLDFVVGSYRALPTSVQRNFLFPALAATQEPKLPEVSLASAVGDELGLGEVQDKPAAISTPLQKEVKSVDKPDETSIRQVPASPATGLPPSPKPRMALRSNASFRVLTECPLVVMLMFQLYPKFLKSNIPVLINVMMEALSLRAPPIQTIATPTQKLDSNGQRLYFSRCRELVAAQAKTLSFLTYLLRGFSTELKPYEDRLASNVVALMSTCPKEFVSTRRELLVATRHLLNSDFRNGFFKHIDTLLDERVLMGSHHRYSDQTVLRPLAYTTLSDLVHQVRSTLNMKQVSCVVSIFSRVLHDTSMTLPISTQYTAVRSLLSVVEMVSHNKDPDPQVGRDILVRILRTLVDKLTTVQNYLLLIRESVAARVPDREGELDSKQSTESHDLGMGEIATKLKLPAGVSVGESIRDLKSMIKAIIVGHKTVIWYISNYRAQREKENMENLQPLLGANEEVASAMMKITNTEHALIDKYISLAFPCMKILNEPGVESPFTETKRGTNGKSHTSEQYREALTYFAAAFTTLDGHDLRRILGRRLDVVIEAIVEEPTAMLVPRHLLGTNATTSFEFSRILLNYLVQRMDDLDPTKSGGTLFISEKPRTADSKSSTLAERIDEEFKKSKEAEAVSNKRSLTYLQLFERVLKSLSAFAENEATLRPHLRTIVSTCLRSSLERDVFVPDNYCMLLRFLFRSISAGKFEASYRELLPIIPTAINGLYRVLGSTNDEIHQEIIMELILTIPVRLSSLLPHMNLLLRVIIKALEANSIELANLGLRTLEFWVDNVHPEFLYPELSKQTNLYADLLKALSSHLRPAPYRYGLFTLRLLGKLGGKNRQILREPIAIKPASAVDKVGEMFTIECGWSNDGFPATTWPDSMDAKSDGQTSFKIDVPLTQIVKVLRREATRQPAETRETTNENTDAPIDRSTAGKPCWSNNIEKLDLVHYCEEAISTTKACQVEEAFQIFQMLLLNLIEVGDIKKHQLQKTDGAVHLTVSDNITEIQRHMAKLEGQDSQLYLITLGLLFASTIDTTAADAKALLEGLFTYLVLYIRSFQNCFIRIDANGSPVIHRASSIGEDSKTDPHQELHRDLFGCGLGSLKPFGYFGLSGDLRNSANPLIVARSLAEFLSVPNKSTIRIGLDVLRDLLVFPFAGSDTQTETPRTIDEFDRGILIFYESLLHALCELATSCLWNQREGIYEGLCLMLEELGQSWGRIYETEVLQVALFSVKSAPRELSAACIAAFKFMCRASCLLYGGPTFESCQASGFVWDILSGVAMKEVSNDSDKPSETKAEDKPDEPKMDTTPHEAKVDTTTAEVKKVAEPDEPKTETMPNDTSGIVKAEVKANEDEATARIDSADIVEQQISTDVSKDKPTSTSTATKVDTVDAHASELKGEPRKEEPITEEDSAVHDKPTATKEDSFAICPCDDILHLLITELASTNHLTRVAARFVMVNFVIDRLSKESLKERFESQLTAIRRVLFSRSLRLLPLPEQVGAVEALSIVIDQIPELIPLGDQQLLAFLSELLKTTSIADSEMQDANLTGYVVDKNGHAILAQEAQSKDTHAKKRVEHASLIFLRRLCIATINGTNIVIPQELPYGIQLRVSSIRLLRSVIRTHPTDFFDAESSTPIGNIRPHVISLLFRSLVSSPLTAVDAAHAALQDVLSLSVVSSESSDGSKSRSKLPKELLQTCIRPVLLNLRDYTRLSQPLLRGLSRLLSLLSSWFNKTLGEKLLDHLQQWTDPNRIKIQKIWKEGDEPSVAAAIVGLFALLPHASNFVEPLVKTTIKLEANLPAYKSIHTISPFRKPLARYLNKHCQGTMMFFFQRLKTPLYSELFQYIVALKESASLREYLCGRQCSVNILNVCFERPLAIMRPEKTAAPSTPKSGTQKSASELLVLHGIQPDELLKMRQEIDTKRRKLLILQKDLTRASEALQNKKSTSSTGEITAAMEEFKRKQKNAKLATEKVAKELNDCKQRYTAEAARCNSRSKDGAARPMTIEFMELQHQGFSLVRTLMDFNPSYLKDHNDVLRAFRLLWRSKGRYLRLQNEESVPPRYQSESKMLLTFLVDYAKNSPDDVDVLFELPRIFLQPTTGDFLFIKTFLFDTVSNVLQIEQKKGIIQRFFALLAGDSSEETKTLSIQLVIYPMLHELQHVGDKESSNEAMSGVLDKTIVEKLVKQVLFQKGSPVICSDRLKVELLRVTHVLLESVPDYFEGLTKELIKYCWVLLKSEDITCKSWAYYVISRTIVSFETPQKIVSQVYSSLLRHHQPEGKELIRAALDILVPFLPGRLDHEEIPKITQSVHRLMLDDGNSGPQLTHVWQTIVHNPDVFAPQRFVFSKSMISSLNRIGLPLNGPLENRALAVSVVELVLLNWYKEDAVIESNDGASPSKKPSAAKRTAPNELEYMGSPDKKRKTSTGNTPVFSKHRSPQFRLDTTMIDTMGNFLVRLKILLADQKIDPTNHNLDVRITLLLQRILRKWPQSALKSTYFEKVVQICHDDNVSKKTKVPPPDKSQKTPAKALKSSGAAKSEQQTVNPILLASCLDVFIVVAECAPSNSLFVANTAHIKEIVTACFRHCYKPSESCLKGKLRKFITVSVSLGYESGDAEEIIQCINVNLERFLLEARHAQVKSQETVQTSPSSRHSTHPAENEENVELALAAFAIAIIEELQTKHQGYVEKFSSALLKLAETMTANHLHSASTKQKQIGTSQVSHPGMSSIPQMYRTPTEGVLAESSKHELASKSLNATPRNGQKKATYQMTDLTDHSRDVRLLNLVIGLLGSGNIAYNFTQQRKTFVHLIGNILESSNSVHLLTAAVRCAGDWLLSDIHACPLTSKERTNFMWKIASVDFTGLPDIVTQPLADLVTHLVEALSTKHGFGKGQADSHSAKLMSDHDEDNKAMQRLLVACLLTTNHVNREKMIPIYLRYMESQRTQGQAESERTDPADNACSNILRHLLHSDFEGLGGRSWIVVFVELLLRQSVPQWHKEGYLVSMPSNEEEESSAIQISSHVNVRYSQFMEMVSKKQKDILPSSLIKCLRRLIHGEVDIAESLLSTMLPAAWHAISDDTIRLRLSRALELLLAKPYHSQILKHADYGNCHSVPTNSVKAFLKAVAHLKPFPLLNAAMLSVLAEHYNSWYEVLSLLEKQRSLLGSASAPRNTSILLADCLQAMQKCYHALKEDDLAVTVALEACKSKETRRAVSLDIHGKVAEALDAYGDLIELVESCSISPSEREMQLWEDRWIHLQREQCQLEVISEYANSSSNALLMLECAWKERNWEKVRSLSKSALLVAAVESGDPTVKMSETLLAVADGELNRVENLHAQTAQLVLHKWQLLPSLSSGSHAHESLLHFFHRLVEIRESGKIMVETSNHSSTKTLPDLKNILSAWRHRLPNDCENLSTWDELLTWRTHMFSAVTSNFHWSEPDVLATLHDRPWTAIRMAKAARKQGMRDTALLLLNRLTGAMDVSDAYLKLREQILIYKNPDSDLERTGGLNLINTTNLRYFDAPQNSELFRLKASFLSSLGRKSKSNQAYCHSVQLYSSHANAWISWGDLCSSLGALQEKQAEQLAAKATTPAEAKESKASLVKKVAQYLAQAMGCYIEAIQIDSCERSRIHLPKCLWMLTRDGASAGVLCQTLENRAATLPSWVWLPWVPQLLTSLCRIEGRSVKSILSRLVKCYPQAVYYSLRAFYLERRDVERAKGVSATSGQHMHSVAYAEELMSTLRRSHASLWSSLEAILEELIVKFRPSYEEELLTTISALLERAESHAEKSSLSDKARREHEDAMVSSWSKTLSRIAAKFFRSTDTTTASSRRDERIKKTAEFKRKYKSDFEEDFRLKASDSKSDSTSDPQPQFQLDEYIVRLQKWKRKLEAQVACTPKALPLVESSQALAMFAGDIPDLWPGSCDPKQLSISPEREMAIDDGSAQSTTLSSAAAAKKAALTAALSASNSAAREGIGGDFGGGSTAIEIPGQYCPNSCSSSDVKPNSELHAKLVRFQPFVQVLRRNDQLVRRTGMVGSDGKTHHFLLQFAIPYWTRTDERAAQTSYVVDKFLRKHVGSARNHLSTQPNAAIPVAQRLRMTLDADSRVSLDEVWKTSAPGEYEKLSQLFLEQVKELLATNLSESPSDGEKKAAEKSARIEVFQTIAGKHVDDGILRRHLLRLFPHPESYFQFRKAFANQLAANSLMQYAFSTAERTPPRFVFLQSNGRLLSPDFRVSYTNQGFIDSQDVPFRMTQNIETAIGQPHFDGAFIKSFVTIAAAIREHRDDFDPILRLLMRDDILAWYSRSLAKSDSKTQELERQLMERVNRNVAILQARFSDCAPTKNAESSEGVDTKVRQLYKAATNPENLSMMASNYHPWL